VLNASANVKSGLSEKTDTYVTPEKLGKNLGDEILKQIERESQLHTDINEKMGITGELSRAYRDSIIETVPSAIRLGFDIKNLTYDHVIPKSKWKNSISSLTSWTNIVTACVDCNRRKGNKTPTQANMPLKTFPSIPTNKHIRYLPVISRLSTIKENIPEEWKIYLPESYF
jgi:hypothetical protein